MLNRLCEISEVAAAIRRGDELLLAGDEAALRQLPRGSWIAGTIPYFMTEAGGVMDRERIFVNALPPGLRARRIRRYGEADIARVYADLSPGGFGVIIAPASSAVHLSFALEAPGYDRFAVRPLVGWIAGVHLSDVGSRRPLVFDGSTGEALEQEAVVMEVALPRGTVAEIGILNIFQAGGGPTITFPSNGFSARDVEIDGRRCNLAEHIGANGLDPRLPLVADYCGTSINVSFQAVDPESGRVHFYAPVFAGVQYRHARPVRDYVSEFVSRLPHALEERVAFSCNCILNYLHSGLEGRKLGNIVGPVTFGEIAYQLLNQTMAYVSIEKAG